MPLILDKEQQLAVTKQSGPAAVLRMYEAAALCPKCKAFQTISLVGERLVETRKFSQKDGQIFHDCGSNEPCRVYRNI